MLSCSYLFLVRYHSVVLILKSLNIIDVKIKLFLLKMIVLYEHCNFIKVMALLAQKKNEIIQSTDINCDFFPKCWGDYLKFS